MKLRRIEIEHVRSLRAFAWSPGDFNLVEGDGAHDLLRALALFAASAQGWSRFSELMSAEPRPDPELLRDGSIETTWKVTLAPDPDGQHEFLSELVVERFHGEPGWEVVFERIARFDDFDDIELLGRRGGRCEFTLSPPKRGFSSGSNAPKKKESARVAGDMTALGALPKFRADPRVSAHADAIADWALYQDFDVTHGAPARKPSVERWFHGRLAEDGCNLINVLYNIHDWYAARDTFARALRSVIPGFDRWIFPPVGEMEVGLALRTRDGVTTSLSELPDPVLRAVLVFAALASPEPPQVTWLDSPEKSLPAWSIPALAELAREAAGKTQVVISGASPALGRRLRELGASVTSLP